MTTNKNGWVLVTGGSGFIGSYCIAYLLQAGYRVKTTVRSLSRANEVREMLHRAGAPGIEGVVFTEADLTKDDGWAEAVQGADYVLHVASPFPIGEPNDENELITPAREGTLRVLKAARDAGVKRVVLTSSFAAVGYGREIGNHVFTEEDWSDINAPVGAYIKSKTVAERAAWDFMEREGGSMELSVVNPVGVFGPVLGSDVSSSIKYLIGTVNGSITESPAFTFGIVDVRDVAAMHITAMTHPEAKGERFIATAEGVMSLYDIAEVVRKERPTFAGQIADLTNTAQEYYTKMSNTKAKTILNWTPRSREEAIIATVDSLKNLNIL